MKRNVSLLLLVVFVSLGGQTLAFNYKFWEYIFPPKKEVLTPLQQIRTLDRKKLQTDINSVDIYLANMADKMDQVNQDVRMLNLEGAEILNTIKDIIDSSSSSADTSTDKKSDASTNSASQTKTQTSGQKSRRLLQKVVQPLVTPSVPRKHSAADAFEMVLTGEQDRKLSAGSLMKSGAAKEMEIKRALEQIERLADAFGVSDGNSHLESEPKAVNPNQPKRSRYDQETLDNWSKYFGDSKEVEKLIDVLLRKS